MKFQCQRCGACCKLAILKVQAGLEDLPCREDGSCEHLQKKEGIYFCDIFEQRPDTCRSAFVVKMYGMTDSQYDKLATDICKQLEQLVKMKTYYVDTE